MLAAGLTRRAHRWLLHGTGACGVATVVLAGAGCEGSFDDSHIRSVPLTVDAPCDTDGVELDFETDSFNANGDHHIEAVIVDGIADDCAGATVTVQFLTERRGVEYPYGGSAPANPDGPTVVHPSIMFYPRDEAGVRVGPHELIHLDVTAINVTITP